MLTYIIIFWILIKLSAPTWVFVLAGICAVFKIIYAILNLIVKIIDD